MLLYFGAEALVGGSSAIAIELGVKPLVVGLTVVAFGTSSPELLVCLTAAIEHTSATDQISIGNIIGSNIANIALILGIASLINPIQVTQRAVRREYPLMLAASVLLVVVIVLDPTGALVLSRLDGGLLLSGMIGYLLYSYVTSLYSDVDEEEDEEPPAVELDEAEEAAEEETPMWVNVTKIVFGIGGLGIGAYWMVESSVVIARALEVPELVIGISIVAFGTSIPEL
ncbi:MAG: sodium:calcium antiporter, partial [Bradymonadaceae bacterium]